MDNFEFQIENFMLYCSSKNLSRKTLASYEQSLKLLALYLKKEHGLVDVEKLSTSHIRHYVKYLRERGKYTVTINENSNKYNHPDHRHDYNKKISDTTIANYTRNIKVFLKFLYEEREIHSDIASKIENIKPTRKPKALLSRDDIEKVLRTFDTTTFHGFRDWVITRLLLDTGMRVSECLSLTPEELDFKNKAILIKNPKNKVERFVYFSSKTGRHLKSWLLYRDRYSDSPHLFPTIRGTVLQVRNYEKTLREIGKKLDITIQPHQLRNNFAKYYLLNGGDWVSLSRILGHSSVEVTQKAYLDFTDEEIGRKYQKHSPIDFLNI